MAARGRVGLLALLATAGLLVASAAPASANLIFAGKWGSAGTGPGQFSSPEGIAVGGLGTQYVYVADTQNHRIQKFDLLGNFVATWGSFGAGDGQFNRPTGVTVDPAGNVFVADTGNNRIQAFNSTGGLFRKWGSLGTGDGQFNAPTGVVANQYSRNVYVADTGNNRIQQFEWPAYNFIGKFGMPGSGDLGFNAPTDLAFDSSGYLYVTDSLNYRVKKSNWSMFLLSWGSPGTAPGAFNYPRGITVDSADNVVVSDINNHRVQRFSTDGGFIDTTGSQGSGDAQFQSPAGVAAAIGGNTYVADTANNRIQRFRSPATIRVIKDAIPDDPQDFDFTAGGGLAPPSFQLDDDGDGGNGLSSMRVFSVDPGSGYSVAESVPPGWDLTSATCSDGSPPSNIEANEGEVIDCTFTNTKRGRIVVVQDSQLDDPQDFSFTAGGGLSPSSFQLDDDGDNGNALSNTQVFADLLPGGGYSISQTTPPGWQAAEVTCSNGSVPSFIQVEAGETVTCTFVNVSNGASKIIVVKDAQPDDPQDFDFTGGGGIDASFQLDNDGDSFLPASRRFVVAPGSGHSVAENTPSGWVLSSATCSDGSPPSNIDVSGGETVTCTFVNQKRGKIVVVKDAQPDDPQDFTFTAGGGLSPTSFQLDDDGNNSNGLSSTRQFDDVAPGSGYSVSEQAPPAGWDLSSATCSDGSNPSNINVAPAETVTCTFTNRKRGQITVVKNATPDDPQDFSFTAGGGLSPSSFELDDDGNNANELSSSRTFGLVVPGAGYSIGETVPAGWDLTSTSCSDGSSVSNISVSPGESVTCTFNNRKRGNIIAVLDTQPDDPQDFDFTTSGGLSPSSFTLDDDGNNGNGVSNARAFANVVPGSGYGFSPSPVASWLAEVATCNDGSAPSNISLSPGETVTCTFVMTHKARIVIVKDAQPDNEQNFSFTAGGGLSPSSFQLDDDGDDTNGLSRKREFVVVAGSGYSVTESPPPSPWTAIGSSCTDGSPVSNIDVSQGESVTCTFLNRSDNYDAYPRPKGATPFTVDLVPSFHPCAAPNRTHGPPLAYPSCNPPVQTSTAVTVGTPDANGSAANSEGTVRLVVAWAPGGPEDTDVLLTTSIVDLRCKAGTTSCGDANAADGADYTGQLQGNANLRITDLDSTGSGTVVDIPFPWPYTCASTASTAIGGTCTGNSSFDAILPGAVKEGRRSIWELSQVQITDGGTDGQTSTAPNTLLMVQGIFAP